MTGAGLQAHLGAGFADPVHDAQRAFRAALDALARPGRRVEVGTAIKGLALGPAMSHLLLALTDDTAAVWWQEAALPAAHWLRFHTGAGMAGTPAEAAFACIDDAAGMPGLDAFSQGTAASPEHSTTLLVEVPSLDDGPAMQWHGPGIPGNPGTCRVRIAGLPHGFWSQWRTNHAAFPQGVDLIFTCGAQALGLPRTTRASHLEGA